MTDYIMNFTDPLSGSFVIKPYTSNGARFPTTSVRPTSSTVSNSPLLLYGKGHADYGERTDENLLHLTENFAGASKPLNAIAGMLWFRRKLYFYNSSGAMWYVWNGSSWDNITGQVTVASSLPVSGSNGQLYYITGSPGSNKLYRYSDDEREIQSWIEREFTEGAYDPNVGTGSPLTPLALPEDLVIYNGSDWDTSYIVQTSGALSAGLDSIYLRLDGGNSPTGTMSWNSQDLLNVGSFTGSTISVTGNITTSSGNVNISNGTLNITGSGSPQTAAVIAGTVDITGDVTVNSQVFGSNQSASAPTYTFTADTDTGMYRSNTNELSFATDGFRRLTIESNGTLNVSNTLNYENLVTDDDDIPNKRYVDDAVVGGGAGTFVARAGDTMLGDLDMGGGSPQDARILLTDGTAALPSLSFTNDTNTGIYRGFVGSPESEALSFVVNGSRRLAIELNGTLNVADTTNYENLVIDDDDIPNRKFVTDLDTDILPRFNYTHSSSGSPISGSPIGGSPFQATTPQYIVGTNRLWVFVDGIKYVLNVDYQENGFAGFTSTSITWITYPDDGAVIEFIVI